MPLLPSRLFLRIIHKNREIYFLKILTLAVAFACSTLIIVFSLNEFGYDEFHRDANSVFRVVQRNNNESFSGNRLSVSIPPTIFKSLKSNSDSLSVSRVKIMSEISVFTERGVSHHQKVHAADTSISTIFSFDNLYGSIQEFGQRNSAIVSATAAKEYFGTPDCVGQAIKLQSVGDTVLLKVVAVFNNFPQNSHEAFNIFIGFDSQHIQTLGFNPEKSGVYGRMFQGNPVYNKSVLSVHDLAYKLQPITEIYFGPRVTGEDARHGDQYSILILISITSLILFLALTSFVNLTTLTLPYRSKELAIKKLAGTSQLHLTFAFAKESFSIAGFSLLLGIVLILTSSDLLQPILSIDLRSLMISGDLRLIITWLILVFILGVAPIFLILKFTRATPTRLLSTDTITFPRFKRVITFLQLGISIFLIVASVVIKRQVNYSLVKEPGQNHEQIVYMSYPEDLTNEGLRQLRIDWKKYNPNIVDVMATSQLPTSINSKELSSPFYSMLVDPAFGDFFDLRITKGNWFKANNHDSAIIVTEACQAMLGNNQKNVIGVVAGMMEPFNMPEKPVKIRIAPYHNYNFLCIRILEVDIRKTINKLANQFKREPASISFMNKRFEEWVKYQDRLNTLSEILAIISAVLSCCAIYGLSVSLVRDKLKQIAIRKICGASSFHIMRLLIHEFTRQMLIAITIFAPFTYIVVNELLRNFVYATPFNWLDPIFPLAYCGLVIILLCGFQAFSLNRADLSASLKE
jgi:putative ABC transport system permease protein